MLDYFCRSGDIPYEDESRGAYVLSVPHVHLHLLYEQTLADRQPDSALLEEHAREIMRRAVAAFAELLAMTPELRDTAVALPPALQRDLIWLITPYITYLSYPQAEFLHGLGFDWSVGKRPLADSSNQTKQMLSWQEQLLHARLEASPLDHLKQWVDLLHQIGVPATYILVDGVDEFMDAAADPETAFQAVRPLLTALRLMDSTPHLALKFFLPDSIEPFIRRDAAIRLDRGFLFKHIRWGDGDLIEILRGRLSASRLTEYRGRDRLTVGFDALCTPALRGRIEEALVREARGNPRYMLILAGLMARAHFNRKLPDEDDPYLLDRQDWEMALAQYHGRIIQWDRLRQTVQSRVLTLIEQGEHERLEFKSSLRWDVRQKVVNKKLPYVIAKTLAAMMNSNGGYLLIGVADDGRILGIEQDIQSLNKKNLDGFRLVLSQLVERY
ncbi:MAG: ATP-binding protein, partial [Chloroflexi bacterium]|nr:ATP-binding protein [Chloroflexota bacterium]